MSLNHPTIIQDHIDVIITYGTTIMFDKKATKAIEFAFLKHQVLPKMHQQVSIPSDQKAPVQNR